MDLDEANQNRIEDFEKEKYLSWSISIKNRFVLNFQSMSISVSLWAQPHAL